MRQMLIAFIFLSALPAAADDTTCADNKLTIRKCFDKIVPSTLRIAQEKSAQQRIATSEQKDVAREVTGTPAVDTTSANALRDFLSPLTAAVQIANVTEANDAITLDWNLRLSELGNHPIKLQGVFRKPKLWQAFADSLTSDGDRDRLKQGLDDLDDITASATYSPEGVRYGRLLAPHRALFDAIASTVPSRLPAPGMDEVDALLQRLSTQGVEPFKSAVEVDDITFQSITDVGIRELVREKVVAAATQTRDFRAAFDLAYAEAGLNRFSDLLNNQPQFYMSVNRRQRDRLVGPRETGLKVTYERGFTNLNSFRDEPGAADCPSKPTECAAAFKSYVDRADVDAALKSVNRIALSIEYFNSAQYDIVVPSAPAFHVKGSRTKNASFTYGRSLRHDESPHDARFDVSVTYEDVKGDPNRRNRWVGSAIYTQKVTDTMSIPIGLVYASHEKDVPASDRRVSAHFGVLFKMPTIMP